MQLPQNSRRALAARRCLGLLLPLLFVGCALRTGPPEAALPPDQVIEDFKLLHSRVYGVYELGPDRDALHELLGKSFVGRALTREYVEHFTTLVRMRDEETSIDVHKVDYGPVKILRWGPGSVVIDADWSVGGVVTHQGHKHSRVNRYRALYTLSEQPSGELRISATAMRDLRRLRNPLAIDGFFGGGGDGGSAAAFMDPLDYFNAGILSGADGTQSAVDPQARGDKQDPADGQAPDDGKPDAGNPDSAPGDKPDSQDGGDEFLDLEDFWN